MGAIAAVVTISFAISSASDLPASAAPNALLDYKQSVASAHFKASNLDQLESGSPFTKICWRLTPRKRGTERTWCARRETPSARWQLSPARRGARIRVDQDSALLAIRPSVAGVPTGLYRWSLSISDPDCAEAPTGPTSTESGCELRFPSSGGKAIRIRGLVPAGCKAKGAAQVSRGPARGRRIALTFDDGPNAYTPQFLKSLRRLHVKATFFMIGQQVPGKGALLKRMMRDGHELANHSWSHANLGGGGAGATSQLTSTNRAIKRASGFRPCVMRPPYGSTGGDLVRRVRAQGMRSILWDVDPQDWRTPGVGTIVGTILRQTRPGSIILEHDGGGPRGQTLAAVPQYVRTLKARGYKFVTVSELLGYRTTYRLAR